MKKVLFVLSAACALMMSSCQKSTPLTVDPSEIVLYSEGTKQITANPSDGVTFTSEDEFYATVDANGLVTANKVGNTNIKVTSSNGMATIPVTVMSKYSLYPELEPIVNAPVSTMTKILGSNYQQGTSSKGETTYTYANFNSYTTGIIATFSNGVCSNIGVVIPTSNMTMFVNYLKERYTVAGMQNDYYFFLDHDKKVVITMTLYNLSYMMAIYMPYTSSKSGEFNFEEIAEQYRQINF